MDAQKFLETMLRAIEESPVEYLISFLDKSEIVPVTPPTGGSGHALRAFESILINQESYSSGVRNSTHNTTSARTRSLALAA